jgi:hypothetical protein
MRESSPAVAAVTSIVNIAFTLPFLQLFHNSRDFTRQIIPAAKTCRIGRSRKSRKQSDPVHIIRFLFAGTLFSDTIVTDSTKTIADIKCKKSFI